MSFPLVRKEERPYNISFWLVLAHAVPAFASWWASSATQQEHRYRAAAAAWNQRSQGCVMFWHSGTEHSWRALADDRWHLQQQAYFLWGGGILRKPQMVESVIFCTVWESPFFVGLLSMNIHSEVWHSDSILHSVTVKNKLVYGSDSSLSQDSSDASIASIFNGLQSLLANRKPSACM